MAAQSSFESLQHEDKEYLEWLEEWGEVDFSCLKFQPRIKTAYQLEAHRKLLLLEGTRLKRAKLIQEGKTLHQIDHPEEEVPNKRKSKKKAQIEEPVVDPFTEQYLLELAKLTAIVEPKTADPVLANRFDFTFNNFRNEGVEKMTEILDEAKHVYDV